MEAEMMSLRGRTGERVVEVKTGAPDLPQMPAPSPLDTDTAVRSLVEVLLPGPEQPALTEEAASSASATLGRMAKGDDSLSLAIAQTDGVLHGLSEVCNSARSDSARAAAAETLGILAYNDANKVAIRCTPSACRGLIRVCTKAAERIERRSALTRTVQNASEGIRSLRDSRAQDLKRRAREMMLMGPPQCAGATKTYGTTAQLDPKDDEIAPLKANAEAKAKAQELLEQGKHESDAKDYAGAIATFDDALKAFDSQTVPEPYPQLTELRDEIVANRANAVTKQEAADLKAQGEKELEDGDYAKAAECTEKEPEESALAPGTLPCKPVVMGRVMTEPERQADEPNPWGDDEQLRAKVQFLKQQHREALHELMTDPEPAAAATDALVAGAKTLACLMERTVTSDQATKTVQACDKRIEALGSQVRVAEQIITAARSAEQATRGRLTLLYVFNKWRPLKSVDAYDRTLITAAHEARRLAMRRTVEATAEIRKAHKACKGKQQELILAIRVQEKAKAVELAAALTPADVNIDSENVSKLKKKVSYLAHLRTQRERQANASLVKLLEHKQRQRARRNPPIISWVPRGMPRQAGARLAQVPWQVGLRNELSAMKLSALRRRAEADGVDYGAMADAADGVTGNEKTALIELIVSRQAVHTVPCMQKQFETLACEELARMSSTEPPGFLTQIDPARAAHLMVSTMEQVCEGDMIVSKTMESHLWAAATSYALDPLDVDKISNIAQDFRAELLLWMEQTDLARATGDLRATQDAYQEAVTAQSLAFAVYHAADINKEALGQRAIATLTRVCAVAETHGAKAMGAKALGALATHKGLAAWMVVESSGCLQALAGIINICDEETQEQVGGQHQKVQIEPESVPTGRPVHRHPQPDYFTCDREEAWTCAAKALGVLASWHPGAVASTDGLIESLAAMCTDMKLIAVKHRDAAREAAATVLQHLVAIGMSNGVEDLRKRERQKQRNLKIQHEEQGQGKEGMQQQKRQSNLGRWTHHVTMDAMVAGLVQVCTTSGTPTASAAAAAALANLISSASYWSADTSSSELDSYVSCLASYDQTALAPIHRRAANNRSTDIAVPTWDDVRARCAAAIISNGDIVEKCVELCNFETNHDADGDSSQPRALEAGCTANKMSLECLDAGARLLWHLLAVDSSCSERIIDGGGLTALVHVCSTAQKESTLSAAAGALDYCSCIDSAAQKLGADKRAICALVRCCDKLPAGSAGMGGAAGVLCALARNGFHEQIRDTDGAAGGLRKVCELGPTEGKMFAARCLAWLAAPRVT